MQPATDDHFGGAPASCAQFPARSLRIAEMSNCVSSGSFGTRLTQGRTLVEISGSTVVSGKDSISVGEDNDRVFCSVGNDHVWSIGTFAATK